MSRNGSGTMTILTSFTSGSTISSTTMNSNLSDIGSEITNSLPRDGQAGMSGQFKAASGTLAAPGIAWTSDTGTGIRRSASGTMRLVSSGVDIAQIDSTGITMQSGVITDANSVVVVGMPTGAMMMYGATTAPTGWVRCNGRTIGNASSAAAERANADTVNLFTFLYNNYSNSVCAVSGGRGADAATDYAANKTIALPDLRGRSFFGLDDMGNSAASRLGTIITSSTTNGASGGAETATLSQTHLPNITLAGTFSGSGNQTLYTPGTQSRTVGSGGLTDGWAGGGSSAPSISVSGTTSTPLGGSGTAFTNMPPAFLTTFIIKL